MEMISGIWYIYFLLFILLVFLIIAPLQIWSYTKATSIAAQEIIKNQRFIIEILKLQTENHAKANGLDMNGNFDFQG